MRFLRIALVLVPVFGVASVAPADLGKLLEPVAGATLGRPGASVERSDDPPASQPGARNSAALQRGGVARIIRTEAPQQLTEWELVQGIQNDLPKRYDIQGELRVSLVRKWSPLQLPASDFFAECVQLPPTGLASNMNIVVRGVSGGRIVGEWPLQIRAELHQKSWVASQRLESGQLLENGLVTVQTIDVLRESTPPIAADRDLTGFELAQPVSKGKPISRRDLVERALVKRGQFVDAFAGEGGLSIRMRAVALEGGPAGAVIRVKNLDSKKEFYGQVINENQVQVRF